MNEELIAKTHKAIFGQDTIVTEQTGSILLDRIREMSDTYRELYMTVREDLAPDGYGVWTGREERAYCASQVMGCPLYVEQDEYDGFRECDIWVCGDHLYPCDMTDEDCDKVDMDKYCNRQYGDCEDCKYRDDCEGEEE